MEHATPSTEAGTSTALHRIQTIHLGEIHIEDMTLSELTAIRTQLLLALKNSMGNQDERNHTFDLEANDSQIQQIEEAIRNKETELDDKFTTLH